MRIRTIKPEFWEDEIVGTLTREARLLMLASLNAADDEGILRWSPAYLKSTAFIFDEDITVERVQTIMIELESCDMVFPYIGGRAKQRLGFIVNFRKHQQINRPQPSKLPPPSLQSDRTLDMYARRDKWNCHLCGKPVAQGVRDADSLKPSLDHVIAQSKDGSDYPSNIRLAHSGCNKEKCDRPVTEFKTPQRVVSLLEIAERDAMNHSLNHSLTEGKGREGKGREKEEKTCAEAALPPSTPPEPSVVEFPTVGKASAWHLTGSKIAEFVTAYPDIDVLAECRKALGWIQQHKSRRKTPNGMGKFLFAWIGRAQNGGPARNGTPGGNHGRTPWQNPERPGVLRTQDHKSQLAAMLARGQASGAVQRPSAAVGENPEATAGGS